jgi:predicted alpha/beta hydrolase family esterase
VTATPPSITEVRGGVLAVQTDDLRRLGGELGQVCWQLARWAGSDAIRLVEPELVASAALSPATYVDAERALFSAIGHLGRAAMEWGALAALVEAVGQWFGGGEDEIRRFMEVQLGRLIGVGLRTDPGLLLLGATPIALGGAVWWMVSSAQERESARRAVEATITRHPDLVADASSVMDGMVQGLGGWSTPMGASPLAGYAARVYLDEGHAAVTRTATEVADGSRQPRTVADVVRHLRELSDAPDPGLIEIQTWRDADGQTRHVVYLPGTDDLNPLSADSDIRDVEEDLRVASGQRSAYMEGVERAMTQGGVGPSDPVMLVGHSLGGMVAAKELSEGTPFNITNLVTVGAPTAVERGFPTTSHVLSLESSGDVVPHVEGRPNRISAQQTTVTFASGDDTIVGNHEVRTYERGAAAVDASHDAAVRAAVDAIGPFFAPGGEVSDSVFRLTRTATPDRG